MATTFNLTVKRIGFNVGSARSDSAVGGHALGQSAFTLIFLSVPIAATAGIVVIRALNSMAEAIIAVTDNATANTLLPVK